MEMDDLEYLKQLTETESKQNLKLNQILLQAIEEETLLSSKLNDDESLRKTSIGEKLADKVAEFGGSWFFIVSFGFFIFLWIGFNFWLMKNQSFDPYPFILLNLILSCIAAIQAPIIMMSQNRKESKDRRRAENDYLINLKAEIEIRNLHKKIDLSIVDQYAHLCEIQQKQLEILQRIESSLKKNAPPLP